MNFDADTHQALPDKDVESAAKDCQRPKPETEGMEQADEAKVDDVDEAAWLRVSVSVSVVVASVFIFLLKAQ